MRDLIIRAVGSAPPAGLFVHSAKDFLIEQRCDETVLCASEAFAALIEDGLLAFCRTEVGTRYYLTPRGEEVYNSQASQARERLGFYFAS